MEEKSSRKNNLLLKVSDLKTYFTTEDGTVRAVDDVSIDIGYGEILGIVGESGCGKSVTALSIMRLLQYTPGKIVQGEILFEGQDLVKKSPSEMRTIRGNQISMIFQEPMTSLNPVFTIGFQIIETILLHQHVSRTVAKEKTIEMLRLVGIPSPSIRFNEYPHQLSGGMRQRVMIAMALACNPKLLIADEPTTALDVTIQAQILELMKRLKEELGMAVILITHDLGLVAEFANRIYVMYAGKVVESSDIDTIFDYPKHPYTLGLLNSIPKLSEDRERLNVIRGNVPSPLSIPPGCRFHPRCSSAKEICSKQEPDIISVGEGHQVRCWLYS